MLVSRPVFKRLGERVECCRQTRHDIFHTYHFDGQSYRYRQFHWPNCKVTQDGCVSLSKLPLCLPRKQTIAAWKKIRKEDYGFAAEEEGEGENIQDVEISDGEADAEDYDVDYDFGDYKPAAALGDPIQST